MRLIEFLEDEVESRRMAGDDAEAGYVEAAERALDEARALARYVADRYGELVDGCCPIILSPGDAMCAGAINELRLLAEKFGIEVTK